MDEIRDDYEESERGESSRKRRRYARPAVDIFSSDKEIRVVADVPGLKKSDLEVTIDGDDLVIEGPVAGRKERESKLPWGYHRRFRLRSSIDRDRLRAHLEGGVLEIALPRTPREPAKKVVVD